MNSNVRRKPSPETFSIDVTDIAGFQAVVVKYPTGEPLILEVETPGTDFTDPVLTGVTEEDQERWLRLSDKDRQTILSAIN